MTKNDAVFALFIFVAIAFVGYQLGRLNGEDKGRTEAFSRAALIAESSWMACVEDDCSQAKVASLWARQQIEQAQMERKP